MHMIVLLSKCQENNLQIFTTPSNSVQPKLELVSSTGSSMQEPAQKLNPFDLRNDPGQDSSFGTQEAPEHSSVSLQPEIQEEATSKDIELKYMLSEQYPEPLEFYSGPKIRLFQKKDAIAAVNAAQLCDPESCARISKVIKTLASHGEHRKLGQIQNDFNYSLRRLLDKYQQFQEVIEYVVSCAALSQHRGDNVLRMSPILLIGEAGVGKTQFVQEFAALLKVGFKKIDLSASQSNSELAGSSSFWSNSAPSKIFLMASQGLKGESLANPIFLLDEIDKPARSLGFTNADPLGVLHTLLERHSAARFTDLAIDIPLDVSNYTFFATCNDVDLVPNTLRSRFREFVIKISKNQMKDIAVSITHDLIDELPDTEVVFHPSAIEKLSELESPRIMKKYAEDALGRTLLGGRDIVEPNDIKTIVHAKPKMGFL